MRHVTGRTSNAAIFFCLCVTHFARRSGKLIIYGGMRSGDIRVIDFMTKRRLPEAEQRSFTLKDAFQTKEGNGDLNRALIVNDIIIYYVQGGCSVGLRNLRAMKEVSSLNNNVFNRYMPGLRGKQRPEPPRRLTDGGFSTLFGYIAGTSYCR